MNTHPCFPIAICVGMVLSCCARFQHQTREDEPHAVVSIARASTPSLMNAEIKSMDGQPVREGESYRVRPGTHQLVMEIVEREIETAQPVTVTLFHAGNGPPDIQQPGNLHLSESGAMTTSGVNPFQTMQAVSMSVEKRSVRQQTRNFVTVAGRHYEINGAMVSEKSVPKF